MTKHQDANDIVRAMQEHQGGTYDLLKAKIGDEYEPVEVTITEERVERTAWACDNYNPWYMEDSPFGGRIVSPTFLSEYVHKSFYGHYAILSGGGFHAEQGFEFINPHRIGKKVTITGKLVDRYEKGGRDWFVSEYMAIDEDGVEIVRIRSVHVAPAIPRHVTSVKPVDPTTFLSDPTAFQPMKVTASRETEVGFELEPIIKKVNLDKMRLFCDWPRDKWNWHADYSAAHTFGQRLPIIVGDQALEYLGELLVKFFGERYLGGSLSIAFKRVMEADDEITTRGVVREKVAEGDAVRLILDVWCENQRGEKVIVGTASGLVR